MNAERIEHRTEVTGELPDSDVPQEPSDGSFTFDGMDVDVYERLFHAFAGLIVNVNGTDYWLDGPATRDDDPNRIIGVSLYPFRESDTVPQDASDRERVILTVHEIETFIVQ